NNGVSETLNWRTRVRVVVEAAQGLRRENDGSSSVVVEREKGTDLGNNKQ
ncbi:hypothetical protein E2562_034145, partial [Oryza meyeriana var. granulata]